MFAVTAAAVRPALPVRKAARPVSSRAAVRPVARLAHKVRGTNRSRVGTGSRARLPRSVARSVARAGRVSRNEA